MRDEDHEKAELCLNEAFYFDKKTLNRFVLVPLVDNDYWVVVRIDRIHCKLIVADPREAIIRKRHPMVDPLLALLKKVLKRKWEVESLPEAILPRSGDKLYSAVLACLNIACWALFCNKRQRDTENYVEVFTYTTDRHFMQKARHFISRAIYTYGTTQEEMPARAFV